MSNSSRLRMCVRIPDYLALKGLYKIKKRYRCICPGHTDVHPSCKIYHNPWGDQMVCFVCGFRGDIFKVVGVMENLPDKFEQYKFLMNKYGHLI
jgi:hypothetical protein